MPDDMTLAEILGEAEAPASITCAHEAVASRLVGLLGSGNTAGRYEITLNDPPEWVSDMLAKGAGRTLGVGPTWVRFVDPSRRRGFLAAVHCPNPFGEAEMMVVADGGMLSRALIRDLCAWAFLGLGLLRIVVRIHAHDKALCEYARRAGFEFEGTARDFFSQGYDASVWGMSIWRCKWLPRSKIPASPMALPTVDVSPPSSLVRH